MFTSYCVHNMLLRRREGCSLNCCIFRILDLIHATAVSLTDTLCTVKKKGEDVFADGGTVLM